MGWAFCLLDCHTLLVHTEPEKDDGKGKEKKDKKTQSSEMVSSHSLGHYEDTDRGGEGRSKSSGFSERSGGGDEVN